MVYASEWDVEVEVAERGWESIVVEAGTLKLMEPVRRLAVEAEQQLSQPIVQK